MNALKRISLLILKISLTAAGMSGVTYSPYSSNGGCLSSNDITQQLIALNQHTSRIRLFGSDCNQVPNILNAIINNNLNLRVTLGIWTRNGASRFNSDTQAVVTSLRNSNYMSLVDGVVIGNEELYNGGKEADVIANIHNVRGQLTNANIQIPVSYVEVFNLWTPGLAACSDTIMPTIYPFYTANNGASVASVAKQAVGQMLDLMSTLKSNKPLCVGETGFPNAGSAPVMFAAPNQANQCEYLTNFASEARARNVPYFFMEASDALWKSGYSTDQHFGVFSESNQLRCPYNY